MIILDIEPTLYIEAGTQLTNENGQYQYVEPQSLSQLVVLTLVMQHKGDLILIRGDRKLDRPEDTAFCVYDSIM